MKINTNIQFNSDEQEVMSIIRDVIRKYTPSTQAFLVGGVVRDKLIGIDANDLDVMLSNISGEDFAKLVTKHLGIKDAHTIKSNPDKSKFITTSKAYIPLSSGNIQEIDFAQARMDVYDGKSRIPTLKPATPKEDASRRDLTINSIFYDILSKKIVDFTGMGINDLKNNIIRTPEDPLKTFMDDPLRIFRVVRFSAKYNFKIDPQTYTAMLDSRIRDEIKNKVSKERIGQEITKMLSNPNAEYAITLLKSTGLLEDILTESLKGTEYEGKVHPTLDMNQNNSHHTLTLWEHTMEVVKNVVPKYSGERKVVMVLSALFHDLGKLCLEIQQKTENGQTSYHGHEVESAKLVPYILKYLKMDPYVKEVSELVGSHMQLHHRERDNAGLRSLRRFIRQMGEKSLNWLDVFNLTVADAYAKDRSVDEKTVRDYQDLETKLQEALSSIGQLQDSSKKKIDPILNGNEIMNYFNNHKPGVWIKTVMNWLLDLQDQEPNISKEDAQKRMIENFPEFVNKTITASKCSRILIDSTINKINKVIKEKPVEAVSLAKDLMKDHNDDEDVVLLCLKTAIKAKEIDHASLIGSDLVNIGRKMAKKNFLVPEIILNYVIALILSGQEMKDEDKEFLLRAKKMNPEKTRKTIKDILDISGNNKGVLKKVLNEDN
jgi:tRNA nucleotidyltransferase/poly(A) polymerase